MNKDYRIVSGEMEMTPQPSAPLRENYEVVVIAESIPSGVLGAPNGTGAEAGYVQVPGYISNAGITNSYPYLQTTGISQGYASQPQYYHAPGQQPLNGTAPITGYLAGGASAIYPQQPYVPAGAPVPMTPSTIQHRKMNFLICGVPGMYCGGGFCGICCIITIVIIVLAFVLGGSGSSPPDDYLYYRVYEAPSCSGSPVYQYAYPTGTCLTFYEASLTQSTSFTLLPSALNTTKVIYNDDYCRTTETGRQVIEANQCTTLASYPGYSMLTFYQSGKYQSLANSFQVIGYQSRVCQSVGGMISYVFGKCIPLTTSTWVKYTYIPGYRSCTGSGRNTVCSDNPAKRYKDTYFDSSCFGGFNRVDISGDPSCDFVDSSQTTTPYRGYDVSDCFQ